MKLRTIIAATAMVAAIGTQAQPQYLVLNNPQVDMSKFKMDKEGFYVLFDGTSMDGWRGYCKDHIATHTAGFKYLSSDFLVSELTFKIAYIVEQSGCICNIAVYAVIICPIPHIFSHAKHMSRFHCTYMFFARSCILRSVISMIMVFIFHNP